MRELEKEVRASRLRASAVARANKRRLSETPGADLWRYAFLRWVMRNVSPPLSQTGPLSPVSTIGARETVIQPAQKEV